MRRVPWLLDRAECLGARTVAIPDLKLRAVPGRSPRHIQTLAAVAGDKLVVAAAKRDRLPLLIAAAAVAPELEFTAVAGAPVGDIPDQAGRMARDDLVVAAVGRLELPLL